MQKTKQLVTPEQWQQRLATFLNKGWSIDFALERMKEWYEEGTAQEVEAWKQDLALENIKEAKRQGLIDKDFEY